MKITICGSISFYSQMEELGQQLRDLGHEVIVPLLRVEAAERGRDRTMSIRQLLEASGGVDAFPQGHAIWDEKSDAIDDHFAKVAWADAIVVANYDKNGIAGYVGGNTLMEMALARYLRKPIYVLMPIAAALSYKEEILGMKPVFLDNDLGLIV